MNNITIPYDRLKDSNSLRLIWDKIRDSCIDLDESEMKSSDIEDNGIIESGPNARLAESYNNEDPIEESITNSSSEEYLGGFNDWGANRTRVDNRSKCRGFPWTVNEMEIIREWKVQNPLGNIKGCLDYIYANEVCRREFHIHHIDNTARLLTAWRKV